MSYDGGSSSVRVGALGSGGGSSSARVGALCSGGGVAVYRERGKH